jgi:hypothetical protein
MTKAKCEHGRPWFGPCIDCDAGAVEAMNTGMPWWRAMSQVETVRYTNALLREVWDQCRKHSQ